MAGKKLTVEEWLSILLLKLQKEFETHYLEMDIIYQNKTRVVMLLVEYPLSPFVYSATTLIPKKQTKTFFDFLTKDSMDKIYHYINTAALKYDTHYGKQIRKD